jgi:hypothetical protein
MPSERPYSYGAINRPDAPILDLSDRQCHAVSALLASGTRPALNAVDMIFAGVYKSRRRARVDALVASVYPERSGELGVTDAVRGPTPPRPVHPLAFGDYAWWWHELRKRAEGEGEGERR